jgi:UTP--glucose-1-phosphate uridylyltransferase
VSAEGLRASVEKMRADGVAEVAIATFTRLYEQLDAGETGLVAEGDIEPVGDLPGLDALPAPDAAARDALAGAVTIKLNGGLGTSMGMTRAKSLLEVRDGLSFLDVIARQVLALRDRHRIRLPLVLMNSFHTRDDTLAALERYPDLASDVPPEFGQSREPKLRVDDLHPVAWPSDPELEWCPPGHGDLYASLVSSGMLEALLGGGYRHAFVSNSDNLGAVLDPAILGWVAREGIPFLMEVSRRTPADRKGGHLARGRDGRLLLREIAQVPDADRDAFGDIERHRYFNTNSLWIDLRALAARLEAGGQVIGLPLIVNRKTVDPTDPDSPGVYQLETAMGAAISVFEGARALRVGRERFAPVKTTNELLAVRSDCYELTDDCRLRLSPRRGADPPFVDLDPEHFRLLADFEARFPAGPPSLVACERFVVRGDVTFGRDVTVRGDVEVRAAADAPVAIEDGTVLEGEAGA